MADRPAPDLVLSERRQEILEHLAEGRPPKAIAHQLGISVSTCRSHVQAVLDALGVQTALQAVLEAQRRGLLPCRCQGSAPHSEAPALHAAVSVR
jgi:DNA-binding NarL/FixJ family response regulator